MWMGLGAGQEIEVGRRLDSEWYKNFFHGIVLDMWRQAVSPEQTRRDVDFLERALRLAPDSRVLDVPCGAGRHSIPLASRGHRLTGVDLSAGMIKEAREQAAAAGLEIEWREGDLRDLSWRSEFDGGFCFGNSFGYLNPDGTRAFIRAVSGALRPGARFALDYGMAAESILPNLRGREQAQIGDIRFTEENRYHPAEGCVETQYTFERDGRTHLRKGLHWVYTVREIRQFLSEAGLVVEDMLGSLDGQSFRVGSPILIVVAGKK